MSETAVRRPGYINAVAVLTIVAAIVEILLGITYLGLQPAASGPIPGVVVGAAFIVLGLVMLGVARGLLKGDPQSRVVLTFAIVLNVLVSLYAYVAFDNKRALSTFDVVLAVIVVACLWTPRATAWFEGRRSTAVS